MVFLWLYINLLSPWIIFVIFLSTDSRESVYSAIRVPKLKSTTKVRSNQCEIQFKDDYFASVPNTYRNRIKVYVSDVSGGNIVILGLYISTFKPLSQSE